MDKKDNRNNKNSLALGVELGRNIVANYADFTYIMHIQEKLEIYMKTNNVKKIIIGSIVFSIDEKKGTGVTKTLMRIFGGKHETIWDFVDQLFSKDIVVMQENSNNVLVMDNLGGVRTVIYKIFNYNKNASTDENSKNT